MKYIFLFLFMFFSVDASAFAKSPHESFESINSCVQKNDSKTCRDLFTKSSQPLYDRFMSYGLMDCLPKDGQYVSQEKIAGGVMVRASVTDNNKQRFMRLIFVEEEGGWKLDTPESLRLAMGKNWQQQIEVAEQLYLLMKKQFGSELNCSALKTLVKAKKQDK